MKLKKKDIRSMRAFIANAEQLFSWTVGMDDWLRNQCQREIVAVCLEYEAIITQTTTT